MTAFTAVTVVQLNLRKLDRATTTGLDIELDYIFGRNMHVYT